MAKLIEILSGNVPGGLLLLLALLVTVSLAVFFFYASKLISKNSLKKTLSYSYIALFGFYSLVWVVTKPPAPLKRIIVLPLKNETTVKAQDLAYPEFFQSQLAYLKNGYLLHRWQWLFSTIGKDSARYFENWLQTAQRLDPYLLIVPRVVDHSLSIDIFQKKNGAQKNIQITEIRGYEDAFVKVNGAIELFEGSHSTPIEPGHMVARLLLNQDSTAKVLKLLEADTTVDGKILRASAHVQNGLKFDYDWRKKEFVEIKNPAFEQARQLLIPIVREKKDRPPVAYLLGRMAIRERSYENAEVFLKKALVDDFHNARIYYMMSFLLPSRIRELGFDNALDVLDRAVGLDPGYHDAVFELANQYYLNSNGVVSSNYMQKALKTLENFIKINSNDPEVQSLLANLYIKTGKLNQAEKIYKDLQQKYPDDSNAYYNLGALEYTRGNYKKALDYFQRSIKMDENLDAFLYAGLTYRQLSDDSSALEYFRERVRRKTGDDDRYAIEAMKGIRDILESGGSNGVPDAR